MNKSWRLTVYAGLSTWKKPFEAKCNKTFHFYCIFSDFRTFCTIIISILFNINDEHKEKRQHPIRNSFILLSTQIFRHYIRGYLLSFIMLYYELQLWISFLITKYNTVWLKLHRVTKYPNGHYMIFKILWNITFFE
jgi:hypothetical protein